MRWSDMARREPTKLGNCDLETADRPVIIPPVSGVAIGLDVGTSGAKGLAVAPDGAVVARAERGYPLSTPRPGWAEQDPEDWWRASAAVLEELQAAAGAAAGIGLSGQMHGLVALDGADRVVRPAILWNDQRTAAECAEIEQRLGFERLVALTGNRALTGFTAPKLLWLRRHEPEVYERVAAILLPKDYVRLRLCGERASDVTDASGTLLFDVGARAWSDGGVRRARGRPGVAADGAGVAAGQRDHGRRRARRGGRGRPGGGRARGRDRRPRRPRLGRPGHVRRRVRRA